MLEVIIFVTADRGEDQVFRVDPWARAVEKGTAVLEARKMTKAMTKARAMAMAEAGTAEVAVAVGMQTTEVFAAVE